MNAAAAYSQPASSPRTRTPVLPADAATWLGAHFDWTFGAVWVAIERWQVDAATVVAWAEQMRAGGARAGLSTKERTWMLRQLNDPEQRPTAVERAMARTVFLGKAQQPMPVAINTIDDAIALIEARLADDGATDRTTRDARELRQMLLDDLRILRDEQRQVAAQPQHERSEPTMSVHGDAPVLASTASTMTRMGRPPSSEPKERPATCALCGKAFTAKRYGRDWTTYCSKSCGQQATMRRRQQDAQAAPTATQVREQVVVDEPLSPVSPEQQSAAATDVAVDQELYWNSGRWTTQAELDAEADNLALAISEPPPPQEPEHIEGEAEPTAQASEPTATVQSGNGVSDLLALWNLLIGQSAATRDAVSAADDALDDLLSHYLNRLPRSRQWTTRERARWLRAFTAALDLEIETTDEQMSEGQA